MDAYEAKEKIQELSAAILRIDHVVDMENRNLTSEEQGFIAEAQGHIKELTNYLPSTPQTMENRNQLAGALSGKMPTGIEPWAMKGPNDSKTYNSLFGKDYGTKWADNKSNFFQAVFSGRLHPGLIKNSMTETVPADGGFLVPHEQAAKIHAVSLENEIVQPRAYVLPMRSDKMKCPGMSIGDHSSNLFGGFTASYTAEAGTISEASPKTRSVELDAKKLTGLIRFSSELAQDTPGGMGQIETLCGKGLSWYRDQAFLRGQGGGSPLGILNAPCLIAVDKETGQVKDSIVYENLTQMMARMYAGSFQNSIWIFSQSAIPQLLTLSMSVGTGGDHIPAMTQGKDGVFSILTRPVLFTEKTEVLGDQGDALLVDLSQYVIGLRSGMNFDTSIHVQFETDEILARLIERHDGAPLWNEALTLRDGSTTVSPFVTLAERT